MMNFFHKLPKFSLFTLLVFVVILSSAFGQPVKSPVSSYAELSSFSEKKLNGLDIALVNLLCAEGLPGAEGLNLSECLAVLDSWAARVTFEETRYLPKFQREPNLYDNSLNKFKAVNLALTIKNDLGCSYNMDLVTSGAMAEIKSTKFFRNSKDLFLHGFTQDKKGSCASLPVLMVAVGRRCGYPLYLVSCKGHLFCRWDDGKERFNLETAIMGADIFPDSYYHNWPYPFSKSEMESEKYLKNLTPSEELGLFNQLRGMCLQENARYEEAAKAYKLALLSFPMSKMTKAYLNVVKTRSSK